MARYMFRLPGDAENTGRADSLKLAAVEAAMRPHNFTGCSVWRYQGRARHWVLIFDTSAPVQRIGTNADYWARVRQSEEQCNTGHKG